MRELLPTVCLVESSSRPIIVFHPRPAMIVRCSSGCLSLASFPPPTSSNASAITLVSLSSANVSVDAGRIIARVSAMFSSTFFAASTFFGVFVGGVDFLPSSYARDR